MDRYFVAINNGVTGWALAPADAEAPAPEGRAFVTRSEPLAEELARELRAKDIQAVVLGQHNP